MKTDDIIVSTRNLNINNVLENVEDSLEELDLKKKDNLHMRLLAEETIGMLKAMAGDYSALLWFEREGDECRVRVTAKTEEMNYSSKKELLSVSKSGQNSLAKGFMQKLGDVIENSLLNYDEVMKIHQQNGVSGPEEFTFMGMNSSEMMMTWTLEQYRVSIDGSDAYDDTVDELERSIVANLAEDVIVGVKKDHVELTIIFKLKEI